MNHFISIHSLCLAFLFITFTPLSFAAPINDQLAAAIPITTVPFTHQINTQGATNNEPNELIPKCLNSAGASVWYQYTATNNQTIVFDTFEADYDTAISVWSGTQHPLSQLACNDDHSNMVQSQVSLEAKNGTTYYINVSGFRGNTGNLGINVSQVNPLSNDNLANALTITPTANSSYQSTQIIQNATMQAGEQSPSCAQKGADKSVWYQYTATANQTMAFNTTGSDYNTVLSVWTGATHPLTEIACNDDTSGPLSQVGVNLTSGQTYYISVAAGETSAGSLSANTGLLVLNMTASPANDNVANAILIMEPLPYQNTQTTGGATMESAESFPSCSPTANASIWYLFTPTSDYNNVTFSIPEASYDAALSIWEGIGYPFTELGCSDNAITPEQNIESQVTIPLKNNEAVYVDISGVDGETGKVTLQIEEGALDFNLIAQPQSTTINRCETAILTAIVANKNNELIDMTVDPVGSQWETNVNLPFVYKWYQGNIGDTSALAAEVENQASFTTPALLNTTNYWARITNPTGSIDSVIATITVNGGAATCDPDVPDNGNTTNGVGIDANGNPMPTTANFTARITKLRTLEDTFILKQADEMSIIFAVDIDPNHVGQKADILMVGAHTQGSITDYYMRDGVEWKWWNANIAILAAAETQDSLPANLGYVNVFTGNLNELPGNFGIYVGYRLSDGSIFYIGEPITFKVE
jgi:hypothetical protein